MRLERSILWATWRILLAATCCAIPLYAGTDDTPQRPAAEKLSQVRIVRLSFAQGTVTVRRAGSSEWTNALVNSPIQEGFSLARQLVEFNPRDLAQAHGGAVFKLNLGITLLSGTQSRTSPEDARSHGPEARF